MRSKLSQCDQPAKAACGPFPYEKPQQPHITSKLPAGATRASSPRAPPLSSSGGHISTSTPNNTHLSGATKAAQAMRVKRGGSFVAGALNGQGNGRDNFTTPSKLYPPEGGPLDQEIATLIEYSKSANNALALLRAELLLWAERAYNGDTFTDVSDDQIKQLVRVIEELKLTGQCVVRGKSLRPRS